MADPKTPQEYRQLADECERLANSMINPAARETMFFVARRWRDLADEEEAARAADRAKQQADLPESADERLLSPE